MEVVYLCDTCGSSGAGAGESAAEGLRLSADECVREGTGGGGGGRPGRLLCPHCGGAVREENALLRRAMEAVAAQQTEPRDEPSGQQAAAVPASLAALEAWDGLGGATAAARGNSGSSATAGAHAASVGATAAMAMMMPGLPLPPGAEEMLGQAMAGAGFADGAVEGPVKPTSARFLERINTMEVDENSCVLQEIILAIGGDRDEDEDNEERKTEVHATTSPAKRAAVQMQCVASAFSQPFREIWGTQITVASPVTAHEDLQGAVDGAIVIVDRGRCNFVEKALRAQRAGAVAVIVCQTADVWPYLMTDSTGQAKRDGLRIPTVMVSQRDGEVLKRTIEATRAADTPEGTAALNCCRIQCTPSAKECAVCQSEYAVGDRVLRLPCAHFFHDECLRPWLSNHNTCPVCRAELPMEGGTARTSSSSNTRFADEFGDDILEDRVVQRAVDTFVRRLLNES